MLEVPTHSSFSGNLGLCLCPLFRKKKNHICLFLKNSFCLFPPIYMPPSFLLETFPEQHPFSLLTFLWESPCCQLASQGSWGSQIYCSKASWAILLSRLGVNRNNKLSLISSTHQKLPGHLMYYLVSANILLVKRPDNCIRKLRYQLIEQCLW